MSAIAQDMKFGLIIIKEIIAENKGNKTVLDACKLVTNEFKKEVAKGTDDVMSIVNPTRYFILCRTRIMLKLLQDVNSLNAKDENYASKFGIIQEIVNEKIKEEEIALNMQEGNGRK